MRKGEGLSSGTKACQILFKLARKELNLLRVLLKFIQRQCI